VGGSGGDGRCQAGPAAAGAGDDLGRASALVGSPGGRDRRTEEFAGDRQSLRDWGHRYNAEGVEGLRGVRNKGRPPALSAEQMQELDDLVLAGQEAFKEASPPS